VYYGLLENPFPNHDDRGWLLHYNATLTRTKIPGSFGWDNTVSVLPASAAPRYHGTSPYLLVSKYNNHLGVKPHGDGRNKVAVLDPRSSQKDPYANVQTMKAVQAILSPARTGSSTAGTWPATPWQRRSASTAHDPRPTPRPSSVPTARSTPSTTPLSTPSAAS
jgi:hypothetical protein